MNSPFNNVHNAGDFSKRYVTSPQVRIQYHVPQERPGKLLLLSPLSGTIINSFYYIYNNENIFDSEYLLQRQTKSICL